MALIVPWGYLAIIFGAVFAFGAAGHADTGAACVTRATGGGAALPVIAVGRRWSSAGRWGAS